MQFADRIAQEMSLDPGRVQASVELLDDGNTIPFLARYRKEATGSLDEEQLRAVRDRLKALRNLEERRETILATLQEQGHLTDELARRIQTADTLTALEDLYLPYRPKRRTRASDAREKGLEPLARLILQQPRADRSVESYATPFLGEEVATAEEALAGARDIVAEVISEHAGVRGLLRDKALQFSLLQAEKIADADDPKKVYHLYYAFSGRIDRLHPHQILAINRGENEKQLRVKVEIGERDWLLAMRRFVRPDRRSPLAEQLQMAMEDCAKRLLVPAIARDVRRTLTEQAEQHAIQVFATNLQGLLLQPPLPGHTILGIDPGYRTGCKAAVVDPTGKVLATDTLYLHVGAKRQKEAVDKLLDMAARHRVTLVAIGNGTASRETELLVADLIQNRPELGEQKYMIVSEAGASVYSASPLAREELPNLDVTLRGAVSIARRVQDPLAELVKIDPKSIGVGLYQHDVNQKGLAEAVDGVVETAVNRVGVVVNTASPALLTYVAGIGPKLAAQIVAHREADGPFPSRDALRAVKGLGPKSFEQAAGFLRLPDSLEPLDGSAIHPERYDVARLLMSQANISLTDPPAERETALDLFARSVDLEAWAEANGIGRPTLQDILAQLARPGRDPRADAPPPILRSDVLKMEDLRPGMRLQGTVRNVVDFGAFVDIGVKQDGLLHRSQIPRGHTPAVGDVLEVEILKVDIERGRIGLGWA
jgi:uncharacterized protein